MCIRDRLEQFLESLTVAAGRAPHRRTTEVLGGVHVPEVEVLATDQGGKERVEPQTTAAVPAEDEVGHRVVIERSHQEVDHRRDIRSDDGFDHWASRGRFHALGWYPGTSPQLAPGSTGYP